MVILVCCMVATIASADTQAAASAEKLSPAQGPVDLGLVFSMNDILFDIESYQAGLGAKVAWENIGLRGSLDLVVNGAARALSLDVGATGEYHLFPGRISPYVGAFARVGYMYQSGLLSSFPFSLGAVAGIEVFIWDFLSIFAEYSLALDFTLTTNLQTSQTSFDCLIDTRLGNDAKLGIVIYCLRKKAKK